MGKRSFYKFRSIIEAQLVFFSSAHKGNHYKYYLIKTTIRLSVAIQYFDGGSLLYIMTVNGVSSVVKYM